MRPTMVSLVMAMAIGCGPSAAPREERLASPSGPDAVLPEEPAATAPIEWPQNDRDAEARFRALERHLREADGVVVHSSTTSEGAFPSSMRVELACTPGNRARLAIEGTFGEQPVSAVFTSDGTRYRIELDGEERATGETPPALTEALLVGLVRMGILHNAARLTVGEPPDRADGGVRTWTVTGDHAWEGERLTFGIVVAGQPAGRATLDFGEGGWPSRREQIVQFPDGEMRVTETYERFESGAQVDAGQFTF